jgi:hypothetical protein
MTSAAPSPLSAPRTDLIRRVEAHLAKLRCQLQIARSGIPNAYDVVDCRNGQLVMTNINLDDFAQLNDL